MAYIKFNDDPLAKRVSDAYANLCNSYPVKKFLRLIEKCFVIFNGSTKESSFCKLEDFIYPVDSTTNIDFEVCAGDTLVIYDNATGSIPTFAPVGTPLNYPFGASGEYITPNGVDGLGNPIYYVVQNDRTYARGCILYVTYPMKDKNGDDILPADYECQIRFTNRTLTTFTVSLQQFFAHFANPETRAANSLINKIEIINPNANFSIKVAGLLVYTKSNNDASDCAC